MRCYKYTYSDSTAPHPTADSTYLKLFWCLWTFLCGLSGLFWLVGAPSICLTHPCKSTSDTEEEQENGGIQERSRQTEGEEMIKSEMAGNGSCRDRKQSFFSYHLITAGESLQRDAPCFHLTQRGLVCTGCTGKAFLF